MGNIKSAICNLFDVRIKDGTNFTGGTNFTDKLPENYIENKILIDWIKKNINPKYNCTLYQCTKKNKCIFYILETNDAYFCFKFTFKSLLESSNETSTNEPYTSFKLNKSDLKELTNYPIYTKYEKPTDTKIFCTSDGFIFKKNNEYKFFNYEEHEEHNITLSDEFSKSFNKIFTKQSAKALYQCTNKDNVYKIDTNIISPKKYTFYILETNESYFCFKVDTTNNFFKKFNILYLEQDTKNINNEYNEYNKYKKSYNTKLFCTSNSFIFESNNIISTIYGKGKTILHRKDGITQVELIDWKMANGEHPMLYTNIKYKYTFYTPDQNNLELEPTQNNSELEKIQKQIETHNIELSNYVNNLNTTNDLDPCIIRGEEIMFKYKYKNKDKYIFCTTNQSECTTIDKILFNLTYINDFVLSEKTVKIDNTNDDKKFIYFNIDNKPMWIKYNETTHFLRCCNDQINSDNLKRFESFFTINKFIDKDSITYSIGKIKKDYKDKIKQIIYIFENEITIFNKNNIDGTPMKPEYEPRITYNIVVMGSGKIATKLLESQVQPIFITNNYKMLELNILDEKFITNADGFILCNLEPKKSNLNGKPRIIVDDNTNLDTCFAEIAKEIIKNNKV